MDTSQKLVFTRVVTTAAKKRASDIHFSAGSHPVLRIDDNLMELTQEDVITENFLKEVAGTLMDEKSKEALKNNKSVSFVHVFEDKLRLRANVYYQKNSLALSLKLIPLRIPSIDDLGLGETIKGVTKKTRGLVIVSGPYGSGKTTTAASMINEINKSRSENILTIEKPIEYIFFNDKSIVEQREIGRDANCFLDALNDCRNEDVDVVFLGENDEVMTIPLMLDIAVSGRLVFHVMKSISVLQAIEKIINSFPENERRRVHDMLSSSLKAVIVQRLIPRVGGGEVVAKEVLLGTPPVLSLIRDGKIHQLKSLMQTSKDEGMMTMDQSLAHLVRNGEVSLQNAQEEAEDKEIFSQR